MTSVVIWIGVDTRGPTSTYIATDSRFSWQFPDRTEEWDAGRKTFASSRFPDIAGYWGDVLFPIVALSQYFTNLDAGAVCRSDSTAGDRFQAMQESVRLAFRMVPMNQRRSFTIIYGSREGLGMASTFNLHSISWSPLHEWTSEQFDLPSSSAAVKFGGSGAHVTRLHLEEWQKSTQGGTSRAVYGAFVDGLKASKDPLSGGAPQLVGLYRIGNGRSFGTVIDRQRFLHGAPVTSSMPVDDIEWRNELFERVSGTTRERLPRAQRHVRGGQD